MQEFDKKHTKETTKRQKGADWKTAERNAG